ncbi:hypothetical protein TRVL_02414 [Trypanosoma vivax]|nr:hypothetical protein TRVL_02414 [Trypanosoma vivax]
MTVGTSVQHIYSVVSEGERNIRTVIMQKGLLRGGSVAIAQVQKEAARFMGASDSFGVGVMRAVEFMPESVRAHADGSLGFAWKARQAALNSFKSTHGGALATLADAFTRIHLGASSPGLDISSVSFEINYLNAIVENAECTCVTRLLGGNGAGLHQMEYAFQDMEAQKVFARGVHILSCGQ